MRRFRISVLCCLGVLLALPSVAHAQSVQSNREPADHTFARAEALTRLAARSEGAAAWRWLGEAARLYAADYRFGATGPTAAEAALRHGALLERLGRRGPARGAYLHAIELAHQAERRARARLAYAHALRREGAWVEAGEAYFELVLDPSTPGEFLGDSWEWRGRCFQELGDRVAALACYCAWAAVADSLIEEIRAIDARAATAHALGRHAEAARLMTGLHDRLRPLLDPRSDRGADLFARLDRLETLARSRECIWRGLHFRDHESDRELVRVAQREAHRANPELPCSFCRSTVQEHLRGGLAIADDLKIAEPDSTSPARAQDLHPGLLGGHARGVVHSRLFSALALLLFGRCEHPVQHRLPPALETGLKPGDFDQIYPNSGQAFGKPHDHRGGA